MANLEINTTNKLNTKSILIEYDAGYISPEDNKKFVNEVNKLSEGNSIIEEPLFVYAVLQKYNVENRNGRIYPEEILKRECKNYQKLINENRALGECVPAGTEIFTTSGWVNIENILIDNQIFTLNLKTNKVEVESLINIINKKYEDDMIHIFNDDIDMKLTKDHKMVLWDSNDNYFSVSAFEFYNLVINEDEKLNDIKIKYVDEENFYFLKTITISDSKSINVSLEKFNDNVYCVTVPNSTWLMRYNGKVSWTHNCDHPESSIVSVSRISHNIKEIWWEGNVLMGKLEILMSPGFISKGIISCEGDRVANYLRKGIKIGVSSRGVGSLSKENGKNVVQSDFELICWDIVTSPSTPGSWIYNEKPTRDQQMSESKKSNNTLLTDSIDDFLID